MSENTYHSTIANENIAIDSVTKRDGTLAPFDSNKIYNAIKKAGESTGEFGKSESWLLTSQVLKVLKHKFLGIPADYRTYTRYSRTGFNFRQLFCHGQSLYFIS